MPVFSAFRPKVISKFKSKYSGAIEVRQGWGYKYVATGNLIQSGGIVADVWRPILKKVSPFEAKWLILGLGCGTVAKLIPQPAQITGVEIDLVMLEIGRKYFDLDRIPNLKILNIDAKDYLLKTKDKFDFVLVDLYLGDQVPEFVYSKKFLEKLKKVGKRVIINHLFYDEPKRQKAEELVNKLKAVFKKIELVRVLTNLVIIAGHV
ncbi:MAG: Methyltransferase domain protein [Candidatus Amesbacteria bacterium GW2011_GWA2_47_11b]|uniref:Methyltransferase domain protein n=3 Tax=Candidatus Amesiibacteriota TaxID=1752730 RepID=A0A0G1SHR6_9BACT|nr:MAG: Methyltransferase domain protein [Microgenomates group bacterium GW2011_GWC1_46_20]KKU58190.1 MAG: Methyltransferase domain protein [Candidatus Amesbacteria bacterium GW2011_GWA2_47_11b]KKU68984.1 MAG: Methyltransferase domain protein [Candidatus Amesbacteria bacterium GW2011_GWA1_47_20]KKU83362.1 MAG: Methyltransferase domain protein [Candidatus Amesbacteria bacterium GW2011_GWC2_47_8]